MLYLLENSVISILAFGAVLSGILVITAKNPVISVLFLISVFLNVAGYLVLMGVAYLGLVYIIVYVGAIAILFLFVIIMLNLRITELFYTGKAYTQNLPLGTILGVLFFFEILSVSYGIYGNPISFGVAMYNKILYIIYNVDIVNTYSNITYNPMSDTSAISTQYLQIQSIGIGLYTYYSVWLIYASFILILSIVGPIVLCINNKISY